MPKAFTQGGSSGYYCNVSEIIENPSICPLPLEIIPNNMGINLVSVEAISWWEQENGQLKDLTIHFIPA